MSYDIYLTERVSGETIKLPIKHAMIGGTFRADYNPETKAFTPTAIEEAWLNITYNYSRYYYEATENDDRFFGEKDYGDGGYCNLGIRGLYGKTGLESIAMLNDMISRIESKYKKDGEWITTNICEGPNEDYWTSTAANALKPLYQLKVFAELRPDGIWNGD